MMLSDIDETDLSPLMIAEFAISRLDELNRDYYARNRDFLEQTLAQEKRKAAAAGEARNMKL